MLMVCFVMPIETAPTEPAMETYRDCYGTSWYDSRRFTHAQDCQQRARYYSGTKAHMSEVRRLAIWVGRLPAGVSYRCVADGAMRA